MLAQKKWDYAGYLTVIWGDARSVFLHGDANPNRDHSKKTRVDLSDGTVVGNGRAAPFYITHILCASTNEQSRT